MRRIRSSGLSRLYLERAYGRAECRERKNEFDYSPRKTNAWRSYPFTTDVRFRTETSRLTGRWKSYNLRLLLDLTRFKKSACRFHLEPANGSAGHGFVVLTPLFDLEVLVDVSGHPRLGCGHMALQN